MGTALRELGVGAAVGALIDRHALDLERTNELPELGGELLGLRFRCTGTQRCSTR